MADDQAGTTTLGDAAPEPAPAPDPAAASTRSVDRTAAHLAGLLAAATALAVGELVARLNTDWQSLVVSVANVVVTETPGAVARWSIDTLGTAQKPALITGTVLLSLVIGAAIGPVAARRRAVGIAVFVGFGVLGAWAGAVDPLADTTGSIITAVCAAGVGLITLLALLRVAPSTDVGLVGSAANPRAAADASGVTEHPTDPHASRRNFFAWAGAASALAASSAGLARLTGGSSPAEAARAEVVLRGDGAAAGPANLPVGLEGEVDGVSSLITPNADFYRIDTALLVPDVDPAGWALEIRGMVDNPYSLSYDELLEMADRQYDVTLSCVSNEVGGDLVGNARWTGVPLAEVLDRAGVQPGATQIVGRSVDGWTGGFPTEAAYDGRPAIIAVGMNGEPLPLRHGFPARLVIGGLYGYVSATKWLSDIELTTWEDFDGYWIPRGWSKEGPIKTQSRIDVPRTASTIPAGTTAVAGVAWAGDRGVASVEVQIDEGEWQEARLGEELATTSWRQWVLDWDAPSGEHTIRVRATDGDGETQTSDRARPAPNGATGWDQIQVQVT